MSLIVLHEVSLTAVHSILHTPQHDERDEHDIFRISLPICMCKTDAVETMELKTIKEK